MTVEKPTLLYASPFAPKESGISDYSLILVNALSEFFDITLYIDDYEITSPDLQDFKVLRAGVDVVDFGKFDYKIYNMGNNAEYHVHIYDAAIEHPGAVILHDLSICDFMQGYIRKKEIPYFTHIYEHFGIDAFTALKEARIDGTFGKDIVSKLTLNDELMRVGNKMIVHSEYSRNKLAESGYVKDCDLKKINMIEQIKTGETFIPREELTDKFGIPSDAILVCAFGFASEYKFNIETARAVKELIKETGKKICYVMVGPGDYADGELKDGEVMKTGYTTLEEFNSFVNCADIIVNLRYPPLGETSGSMLRILQLGKPCITNNGGWFSEIPDDIVCKIEIGNVDKELKATLKDLINDPERARLTGERAKEHIKEYHGKRLIAKEFYDFLTK